MADADKPSGQRVPALGMSTAMAAATTGALPFPQQAVSGTETPPETTEMPKSLVLGKVQGDEALSLAPVSAIDAESCKNLNEPMLGITPPGSLVPLSTGSTFTGSIPIGIPTLSMGLETAQGAANTGHAAGARTSSSGQLTGSLSPQGSHQCNLCKRQFSSKHNLRSHKSVVHFGIRKHTCKVCGRAFARGDRLTRHLETQHHIFGSRSRGSSHKSRHSNSVALAQQQAPVAAAGTDMMDQAMLAATAAGPDQVSLSTTPHLGANLAQQAAYASGGASMPPALPMMPLHHDAAFADPRAHAVAAPIVPVACKLCNILFPDADSAVRHLLVTHVDVGAVLTPNPLLDAAAQTLQSHSSQQLYQHHQQQLMYEQQQQQQQQHMARIVAHGRHPLMPDDTSPTGATLPYQSATAHLGALPIAVGGGSPPYGPAAVSSSGSIGGLDALAAAVSGGSVATSAAAVAASSMAPALVPAAAGQRVTVDSAMMARTFTGAPMAPAGAYSPHMLASLHQQHQQQLLHQQFLHQQQQQQAYELAAAQGSLPSSTGSPQLHALTSLAIPKGLPATSSMMAPPHLTTAPDFLPTSSTSH